MFTPCVHACLDVCECACACVHVCACEKQLSRRLDHRGMCASISQFCSWCVCMLALIFQEFGRNIVFLRARTRILFFAINAKCGKWRMFLYTSLLNKSQLNQHLQHYYHTSEILHVHVCVCGNAYIYTSLLSFLPMKFFPPRDPVNWNHATIAVQTLQNSYAACTAKLRSWDHSNKSHAVTVDILSVLWCGPGAESQTGCPWNRRRRANLRQSAFLFWSRKRKRELTHSAWQSWKCLGAMNFFVFILRHVLLQAELKISLHITLSIMILEVKTLVDRRLFLDDPICSLVLLAVQMLTVVQHIYAGALDVIVK